MINAIWLQRVFCSFGFAIFIILSVPPTSLYYLVGIDCSSHSSHTIFPSWPQFFITTTVCGWLDDRHVVFGEVIEGLETLRKVEAVGSNSGKPRVPVVIKDCGELKA